MSETHEDKVRAVLSRLDGWANPFGATIVGLNETFEDAPHYIRVWLLEGGVVIQGFGGSHHVTNRHTGVLQLSVFSPSGRGEGDGLSIAQGAAKLFSNKRYSGMVFRGATIRPQDQDENHMRHDATLVYYWDEQVIVEYV